MLFNARLQNKLHLSFWYKSSDDPVKQDLLKQMSVISEQHEREGYFIPFTRHHSRTVHAKWSTTEEHKNKFWHQWCKEEDETPTGMDEGLPYRNALFISNEDSIHEDSIDPIG